MSSLEDAAVVSLARSLCAAEGWEPDEVVLIEDPTGSGRVPRWRIYEPAARQRLLDWDEF